MSNPTIACLLSTHRRLKYLDEQIAAVRGQTVRPAEIRVWHDGPEPLPKLNGIVAVQASKSLGVWPRFLHCLELDAEFVCIFDDDTIPGRRWLENCLATFERTRGLIGTVGVRFPRGTRDGMTRWGWPRPGEHEVEVDICGHSWFLPRDWLWAFAAEERPPQRYRTCGEDYHLSMSLQRKLRVRSYAAPHPRRHRDLWGSRKGHEYGCDDKSLWKLPTEFLKKAAVHDWYRAHGWILVHERITDTPAARPA